jgi:hypothetical protein
MIFPTLDLSKSTGLFFLSKKKKTKIDSRKNGVLDRLVEEGNRGERTSGNRRANERAFVSHATAIISWLVQRTRGPQSCCERVVAMWRNTHGTKIVARPWPAFLMACVIGMAVGAADGALPTSVSSTRSGRIYGFPAFFRSP